MRNYMLVTIMLGVKGLKRSTQRRAVLSVSVFRLTA